MTTTNNGTWILVQEPKTARSTNGTIWDSRYFTLSSWTVESGDVSWPQNLTSQTGERAYLSRAASPSKATAPTSVSNITFRNIHPIQGSQPADLHALLYLYIPPFELTIPYLGLSLMPSTNSYRNCDSSRLKISDICWENITGTSRYNVVARIPCSASTPCVEFQFSGIDIKPQNGGLPRCCARVSGTRRAWGCCVRHRVQD